jgi:hypothetical protein
MKQESENIKMMMTRRRDLNLCASLRIKVLAFTMVLIEGWTGHWQEI